MTKRHSWPIRAVLFSGAMAFCLAPAMAQHHDDKDGHAKTEHSEKAHKDHKAGGHEKGAAHGHDAHGGAAHGGHHDAGHKDVIGGVVGALTGAAHGHDAHGHDAHGGHHAMKRNPHHHFSYNGHRHEAFRGPAFHWPHGHAYHRPHAGWVLPSLFLVAQYMLHDYGAYGLEPPPPGAAWVRYGPDILLVDRHNGHVIKVIYGAFVP